MGDRRLGIIRRFSLADVDPEWENCYLTYRPSNYAELTALQSVDNASMTNESSVDYMVGYIKAHVIGGEVLLLNDSDQLETAKLAADDIDSFPPPVINSLFATISGARLDPKDTPKVAEPALKLASDSDTTATLSSEA